MLSDTLSIHGFTVVRLAIAEPTIEMGGEEGGKTNEITDVATHYLYLKEHAVKRHHQSKPQKRTLLICNVPPYFNETAIKTIFEGSQCGRVQRVFLHLKPETGSAEEENFLKQFTSAFPNPDDDVFTTRYAYVVFQTASGVENALQLPHDKPLTVQANAFKTGVEKWCEQYQQSTAEFDLSSLEKEIEGYVVDYDKKKQEAEKEAKMEEQEDGDGWVKVSRKRGARFTESEQQHQHRKDKRRKEDQELVHFYRFQLRESRREKIADLRRRFEEDKQRIALLRQQRKFKPF